MDESARTTTPRDDAATEDWPVRELPAVAPAVAAMTVAAAGLTLLAGYWLYRASRRDAEKRSAFPSPAVHRRPG